MSSKSDDRGWNIVGKKARSAWFARLMGATKSDEFPVVAVLFWGFAALIAGRFFGFW